MRHLDRAFDHLTGDGVNFNLVFLAVVALDVEFVRQGAVRFDLVFGFDHSARESLEGGRLGIRFRDLHLGRPLCVGRADFLFDFAHLGGGGVTLDVPSAAVGLLHVKLVHSGLVFSLDFELDHGARVGFQYGVGAGDDLVVGLRGERSKGECGCSNQNTMGHYRISEG